MNCEHARDLLSAAADGEVLAGERAVLETHLTHCPDCRAHARRIEHLDRRVRVRPAEPVPDLVEAVTARARPARLGRGGWIRPALAWVAIVIAVQSTPAFVLGQASGAETHVARHVGAFGVALAVGLAYAAWRPHRAYGLLPFAFALVGTVLLSATFDVLDGDRTAFAESAHIGELVGLLLLWMLAGSPGWHGLPKRRDHRSIAA